MKKFLIRKDEKAIQKNILNAKTQNNYLQKPCDKIHFHSLNNNRLKEKPSRSSKKKTELRRKTQDETKK